MKHERIALVTGANSGIGKITARELARKGMHVLMVCRDARKGEAARQEIIAASGNSRVDLLRCDLSDQDSIVKLASAMRSQYQHLDVLVNNAGLIVEKRLTTPHGLEYTFALNHLAPYLLLDWLRKGEDAKIITVSSEAHRFARLDFSDLQSERQYSALRAYANSKLSNICLPVNWLLPSSQRAFRPIVCTRG